VCDCDITVTVNPFGGFALSTLERNVEMLIDFGLTGNQARVYLAIARLKLATVGQISKVSKVRREDVYRILPKLEKMGLVEKLFQYDGVVSLGRVCTFNPCHDVNNVGFPCLFEGNIT